MEPRRSINEIIDALKHPPKMRSGAEHVSLESYYKQWAESALEALVGAEAAMGQWQDVLARTRDELEDTQQRLVDAEVRHVTTQHRAEQASSVEVTQHWEFHDCAKTYPLVVFDALNSALRVLHSCPTDELPDPYDAMASDLIMHLESIRFEAHPEELEERMEELREEKRLMDMADAEQAPDAGVTDRDFENEIYHDLLRLHGLLAARLVLKGKLMDGKHVWLLEQTRIALDNCRAALDHDVKSIFDDEDGGTVKVPKKPKKPTKRGKR